MPLPEPVLLVDDEPHIRRYLSLILRSLGVTRIIEAGTGEEALALYPREKPALVLLDINMAGISGLETLQALRDLDAEVAVVMLSSLNTRQVVEESVRLGAIGYIRKDTPRDEIVRLLQEQFPSEPQNP